MIPVPRRLCVSAIVLTFATGGTVAPSVAQSSAAAPKSITVDVNSISETGVGRKIGSIAITEGRRGLTLKVAVTGLAGGVRGFHVHENGDCGPGMKDGKMAAGIAAGAHFDPEGTKSHKGPKAAGHKGDLPRLTSSDQGINQTVVAPRLKLADLRGRALVIHAGGDNYSDKPENGGGAGRVACGVVPGP